MSAARRSRVASTVAVEPAAVPEAASSPSGSADASFDPVASSLGLGLDTPASPRSLAIGGAVVAAAILLFLASRRRRSR